MFGGVVVRSFVLTPSSMTNSASELVLVPPWEGNRDADMVQKCFVMVGYGTIYC